MSTPDLGPLAGRRVVLGVGGGVAAYKAVEVCRRLVDAGAQVAPVLTPAALRFVGALTFSALASEPARTTLFDGPEPIPHTRLGQTADLIVVAPATAHLIGAYAAGLADDLLGATLLATRAPVLLAPAMHTEMWEHAAVQANLATLSRRGVHLVGPESGRLAGGDLGAGRLAEPADIVAAAQRVLTVPDLEGCRILVTAGGTREPIDPVRYVGNHSSGKMGYEVAGAAARRGARVTLVTTVDRAVPGGVVDVVRVDTAAAMAEAVLTRFDRTDVVVMAAAVADFRPKEAGAVKWKKGDGVPDLVLESTVDILATLGERRGHQYLVGFAAETGDVARHASEKLVSKRVDLIVGNDVAAPDSGFAVDTNRAVLASATGVEDLGLLTKAELAERILDRVVVGLAPGRARGPADE